MLSRLIGLSALTLLTASGAHAVVTSGECRTDNTAGVTVTGKPDISTTSQIYTDVPDLATTITTQGAVADCAFVKFAGSVRAEGGHMDLRAVLDGVPCDPPRILVANADQHDAFETGSASFICRNIGKGEHEVKIQYRSSAGRLPVIMRNREFSVGFKGR